ncbi:MAG: DMT family transporter [Fimbriimonadaceae bacterium]|nr:DMT family transporter [Alphaproteobacteria bacterium]
MQSTLKAALWMAGWLSCTLLMTVAGRELTNELPVFVVMLLRTMFGALLLLPFVLYFGAMRTNRLKLHVIRSAVHYTAQYSWFYALSAIAIAQVISIEFTLSIWTAILAAIFLGEKLTGSRILAITLGFSGILIITRPGMAEIELGQYVALYAAVGFAITLTMTKSLTGTDSALTVIFYMMAVQTLIGVIPAIYVWQWPSPANWPWVLVIAVVGTVSHYCLTRAMACADATVVVPMDFLRVPLTALVGYLVYNEQIDIFLAFGAVLILSGNMLNLKRKPAEPAI